MMTEYSGFWQVLGFPSALMPVAEVAENETEFTDNHNDEWT